MVDRIAEPQPSAEALRLFPDDLGSLVGVPTFIVYKLWRQMSGSAAGAAGEQSE
jgi:hypothetical protein